MNEDEKQNTCVTVLVEEEERVRRYWIEFFGERGMPLQVFESAPAFLRTVKPAGVPIRFFFDQDMGEERGVGVSLARYVQFWRERVSTSLVTAYPPAFFRRELQDNVIDAVLPKFPSKVFGEGFFEMRMRREIREVGVAPTLADAVDRISTACQKLYAVQGCGLTPETVKLAGGPHE